MVQLRFPRTNRGLQTGCRRARQLLVFSISTLRITLDAVRPVKTAAATLQKFTETAEAVGRTSKRNEKIRLIGELLTSLELSDASLAAQYLTGRAFPQHEERGFGRGTAGAVDRLHEFMVWPNPVSRLHIRCYLRALMSQ